MAFLCRRLGRQRMAPVQLGVLQPKCHIYRSPDICTKGKMSNVALPAECRTTFHSWVPHIGMLYLICNVDKRFVIGTAQL